MTLPVSPIQYQKEHINDNKKPDIVAASAICLSAACIAVLSRFASRRVAGNSLGTDDYFTVLALVITAGFVAAVLCNVRYGLGKQMILINDRVAFEKSFLAVEILYNPAIAATKLSILLLYRRLFPIRSFVRLLWCVFAFVAVFGAVATLVNLLQCLPLNARWDPSIQPRCINLGVGIIVLSSINIITDVAILCLPMPLVWRLQISRAQKLQVSGMFLLGSFVCTGSIIRATYIHSVSVNDGSWADSDISIWSVVETCIAVVSACLPTLRPLISRPAHLASARDRYELAFTSTTSGGSSTFKTSALKSQSSRKISAMPSTAGTDEERIFTPLSDG